MKIYTDGACKGNGREENIGGWGYAVIQNGECLEYKTGINHNTTNNREELMGLIQGLTYCLNNKISKITIVTDSQYVKNGMTQWMHSWLKNGWVNSKKESVKNQDLWKTLNILKNTLTIHFEWVKGHNGNKWNEFVDELINKHITDHYATVQGL
jgi:ribonuclease HI